MDGVILIKYMPVKQSFNSKEDSSVISEKTNAYFERCVVDL